MPLTNCFSLQFRFLLIFLVLGCNINIYSGLLSCRLRHALNMEILVSAGFLLRNIIFYVTIEDRGFYFAFFFPSADFFIFFLLLMGDSRQAKTSDDLFFRSSSFERCWSSILLKTSRRPGVDPSIDQVATI